MRKSCAKSFNKIVIGAVEPQEFFLEKRQKGKGKMTEQKERGKEERVKERRERNRKYINKKSKTEEGIFSLQTICSKLAFDFHILFKNTKLGALKKSSQISFLIEMGS